MEFKKYQHLERFGASEVEGIEFGECYVFPKIDGSNGSLWLSDDGLQAGSRKRHLNGEKDNHGFLKWADKRKKYILFFEKHSNLRLFGEWLIPHSLKTYREDAWNRFYVFDVVQDLDEPLPNGEKFQYLHYDEYKDLLEEFDIEYVPCIAKVKNGTYDQFVNQLKHNVFLIEDGKGTGEGIVIKRYDYINKYGRTTWAKIVTSEFKEKHAKVHGGHEVKGKKCIEEDIAYKYVTSALIEKEHGKICNEVDWSSKLIPRLLNTLYYCVVKEESWNFVKENKNPVIDFNRLKHFVFNKAKESKPELF